MLKCGGVASLPGKALATGLWSMKKLAAEFITSSKTNQTPFERFKAAVSVALTTPKSALPKTEKKPRKK